MAQNLATLRLTDLTGNELRALASYKAATDDEAGNSKCFTVNEQLRSSLDVRDMSAELGAIVTSLDSVFSRCPVLTEQLTVYRGTSTRSFLSKVTPPYRFRSQEFWSTSHTEALVEKFIGLGGALLRLDLPAGARVYNMETIPGAGGSESEILLPRGVLWELVSNVELLSETDPRYPPLLRGRASCKHDNIGLVHLRMIA